MGGSKPISVPTETQQFFRVTQLEIPRRGPLHVGYRVFPSIAANGFQDDFLYGLVDSQQGSLFILISSPIVVWHSLT